MAAVVVSVLPSTESVCYVCPMTHVGLVRSAVSVLTNLWPAPPWPLQAVPSVFILVDSAAADNEETWCGGDPGAQTQTRSCQALMNLSLFTLVFVVSRAFFLCEVTEA